MRTPSARCTPHKVDLHFNTWTTDQDGGRKVKATTVKPDVSCFVQPGTAKLILDESDGTGTRRVTEMTPTKVYFVVDPSLNTEDLIYFTDSSGRSRWYKVLALHAPCATSVLWLAECEERR